MLCCVDICDLIIYRMGMCVGGGGLRKGDGVRWDGMKCKIEDEMDEK